MYKTILFSEKEMGAIAVDGNDDAFVVGSFQETVDFAGTSRTSQGLFDAFLIKASGATGAV